MNRASIFFSVGAADGVVAANVKDDVLQRQ